MLLSKCPFFCIFDFCCFCNFLFFRDVFDKFPKIKNDKIGKQEEQRTTTMRKEDAKHRQMKYYDSKQSKTTSRKTKKNKRRTSKKKANKSKRKSNNQKQKWKTERKQEKNKTETKKERERERERDRKRRKWNEAKEKLRENIKNTQKMPFLRGNLFF